MIVVQSVKLKVHATSGGQYHIHNGLQELELGKLSPEHRKQSSIIVYKA